MPPYGLTALFKQQKRSERETSVRDRKEKEREVLDPLEGGGWLHVQPRIFGYFGLTTKKVQLLFPGRAVAPLPTYF